MLHFSATNYFACSKDAGNWMFGEKNWSKGQVIYNGIELEEYVYDKNKRIAVRDELELNHSFVMGYVGRFESQKNPLFICRIFAELMRRNKHIKLLLVGEGSLHSEMDKYLKQKGIINNVIYTGVVNNVSDYLQAMDCFILPSAFEGLGIVAIEAQAIGLPTLLSETIPEEAMVTELAFKLPIDQGVEIWCDKIEEIIESHQERNDMGQKIIQAGYDISQVAKTLEKFYLKRGKRE